MPHNSILAVDSIINLFLYLKEPCFKRNSLKNWAYRLDKPKCYAIVKIHFCANVTVSKATFLHDFQNSNRV